MLKDVLAFVRVTAEDATRLLESVTKPECVRIIGEILAKNNIAHVSIVCRLAICINRFMVCRLSRW
jgi:hypothetical protein